MELSEGTRARLRKAAVEALEDKQDDQAEQLLKLLNAGLILDQSLEVKPEKTPLKAISTEAVLSKLSSEFMEKGVHAFPGICTGSSIQPLLPLLEDSNQARHAEDYVQIIEAHYIPELKEHHRVTFTTREIMDWIEQKVVFNDMDLIRLPGGRIRWRSRVSDALTALRERSKLYSALNAAQGPQTYFLYPPGQQTTVTQP